MKLLVDAQLPVRLANALNAQGHDAIHTSSLPDGNHTTDAALAATADADARIVMTKDADFRDSHILLGSPRRLLVVATGNITNTELLELVAKRLPEIEAAFSSADRVDLTSSLVITHPRR